MPHFLVREDGMLSEVEASEQAQWYVTQCPEMEPLAFEAQLMIMRAYNAVKSDTPFQHRKGLTNARYNVLRLLIQREQGRMPMGDIIQGMNVSPTNITKLVDGLEKDGLVRRAFDPADKRKIWVELTPAGSNVVLEAFPEVVRHVDSLWQGLSPDERRVLIHLLAKLRLTILTNSSEAQVAAVASLDSDISREPIAV
ncbi:MAG TPA: MarR family transcriptional regulator [Dehalococcoidia bacterium]|nr:MarR family transcriptional regulator [Dehalococcoidia bacterium]